MKLVVIFTEYGGKCMDREQVTFTQTMSPQTMPAHLHEFLTVSARYLGVDMRSLNGESIPWEYDSTMAVTRNNQEVCYATNCLSS